MKTYSSCLATVFHQWRQFVLLLITLCFAALTSAEAPIATTQAGKVRGAVDDGILTFKCVRYGADTSTTRFQPASKPVPWEGVVDALDFAAQAPQSAMGGAGGLFASWANRRDDSEDSLFLNVWTPNLRDGKKRPVMVWFHGGGFAQGSGASHAYDGVRLAKRGDVVVVTVNHRLNVFGHLYLGHYGEQFADSGNVGVLDLKLALEWVRDNIKEFGGDPDNVMIFGESGGGAKVTTLMTMPSAKGLFHRAAVQSGAWLSFIEKDAAEKLSDAIVAELGLTADTIDEITKIPYQTIQQAVTAVARKGIMPNWGPVLDGRALTRHSFTPDAPPASTDVPLLIGLNRTESTMFLGPRVPNAFDLSWEQLPTALSSQLPGMDVEDIIAKYRELRPEYNASDLFFAATTDSRFMRAHVAQAERKAEQDGAPVYFYMLDWDTPVDGGRWRSPHALEIGFVFDNVAKSESMSGIGPEQQRIADLMSEAWIAFARNGNPNNKLLPKWPAYNTKDRGGMIFNLEPKVVNDIHGQERRWFDSLPMGPNG